MWQVEIREGEKTSFHPPTTQFGAARLAAKYMLQSDVVSITIRRCKEHHYGDAGGSSPDVHQAP